MKTDRRLHWVMANRTPRGATAPIGVKISGLIKGALWRDREHRSQLASVLADCVDQEFRQHCRMGDLHNGVLAIEVNEPGLISILQARWASKIEYALRKGGGKAGAHRVLFRFGRGGDRILPNAKGMNQDER